MWSQYTVLNTCFCVIALAGTIYSLVILSKSNVSILKFIFEPQNTYTSSKTYKTNGQFNENVNITTKNNFYQRFLLY